MGKFLTAVVAVMCAACAAQPSVPPAALVPSDAVAMLDLRWRDVHSDALLKQFAGLPAPIVVLRSLGVSLDGADSVIAFATSFDASGETLIVSSPTVVQQFTAAAQRRNWTKTTIHSRELYADRNTAYRALIVSDSVLAIGMDRPLERVAAVSQAEAAPFLARSELRELADIFDSQDPVRMAVAWPTEVRDVSNALVAGSAGILSLVGFGGIGGIVEKFGIGRGMGMSCSRRESALRCRLAGVMQDEATASIVSGGLTVLKSIASLAPTPPPGQAQGVSMSDLTVERHGTTVTVGVSLR